jgi:hypothetical protein
MRWLLIGLAAVLASQALADRAQAQGPCPCAAGGSYAAAPAVSGGVVGGPGVGGSIPAAGLPSSSATVAGSPASPGQVLPYSYYVTAPYPARAYVGFGSTDSFPFYGRAYGNPGDRWSWYYMGGGDRRYLARYYYPLLR